MKSFRVYFKDGNQELFDANDLFSLVEYLNKAYDIVEVYKIEEL